MATAPAQPPAPPMIHTVLTPKDVKWMPAPPSLPAGAQVAALHGDSRNPEVFVMRIKFPKGYALPPHRHPGTEIVTVISGAFRLGQGETADRAKTKTLPPGSFFAFSPGMAHYAFTDVETVVQLSAMGPWSVTYVNPADDPRTK